MSIQSLRSSLSKDTPRNLQFAFQQGLPTGGFADGIAFGSGISTLDLTNTPGETSDEAYGTGLGNGFGFAQGSGFSTNNGGETAGGFGGATALGGGNVVFEIDEAFGASFANQGATTSNFDAGGFVGFNPPNPSDFFGFTSTPTLTFPPTGF